MIKKAEHLIGKAGVFRMSHGEYVKLPKEKLITLLTQYHLSTFGRPGVFYCVDQEKYSAVGFDSAIQTINDNMGG